MSEFAPLYDIQKSWMDNLQNGPCFSATIPERVQTPKSEWTSFLGYSIAQPIGVAAGPLLNSSWIGLAARLGFDLVTYKTIRSYPHPSHPVPNILFAHIDRSIEQIDPQLPILVKQVMPDDQSISITNSFGNPSMSPEYLREDIARANDSLAEGQLMIVSVFGDTLEQYVEAAVLARDAGARVVEANFSCPNLKTGKGSLYLDSVGVYEISRAIKRAIGSIPLIIKVGVFPSIDVIATIFTSAAKAGVGAIAGINTVSRRVVDDHGAPALGPDRQTSGLCGSAIRSVALGFVSQAREVIDRNRFDLQLVGGGGVSEAVHFADLLHAGADVAMCATGMMWNPYLASSFINILCKEK